MSREDVKLLKDSFDLSFINRRDEESQSFKVALAVNMGKCQLCFDLKDVVEVVTNVDITPVPLTPDYIDGMFLLRGEIVTLTNINSFFHLYSESASKQGCRVPFVLIIRASFGVVGVSIMEPSLIHYEDKNVSNEDNKLSQQIVVNDIVYNLVNVSCLSDRLDF